MWAALAVVAVWFAAGAVVLALAAFDATTARDDLEALREELTVDAMREPGGLLERLEASAGRFSTSEGRARSWLVAPLRVVPVVGRQIHSFAHLAEASADALDAVGSVVAETSDQLGAADSSSGDRVSILVSVSEVTGRAVTQLDGLDLGPERGLAGPLASARQRLVSELDDVRGALSDAHEASHAAALLFQGPSRYLILAANNAQMHSGSGMFLSVGMLSAHDGVLEVSDMESINDLPLPVSPVELDPDLFDRWGYTFDPNTDWRHLGMSSRFDLSGRIAADMWEAITGEQLDGVISLDMVAVARLMEATGPIEVDGEWLDADGVLTELLVDQYASLQDLEAYKDHLFENQARRERLGVLAKSVFAAIENDGVDSVDLGAALIDAAAGRHLMVWSRSEQAQQAWARIGISGRLEPRDLLVSLVNRGGNKLDPYIAITARPQFDASRSMVTLELTVRNDAPAGLSTYVAGPYPGTDLEAGDYLGVLTVTAGALASTPVVLDAPHAVQGPDGPTGVAGTWIRVAPGQQVSRSFELQVPPGLDRLSIAPSARVPATTWALGDQVLDDGHRFDWWLR